MLKDYETEIEATPGNYLDVTLGSGGHTLSLIKKLISSLTPEELVQTKVVAFDLDRRGWFFLRQKLTIEGINFKNAGTQKILLEKGLEVEFFNENFTQAQRLLKETEFNLILADLGPSQNLLDDKSLGLSYRYLAPLDMRFDGKLGVKAQDLLLALGRSELKQLFTKYADVPYSAKLAEAIADAKLTHKFANTSDLNQVVIKTMLAEGIGTEVDLAQDLKENDQLAAGNIAKAEFSKRTARELATVYQALRVAVNLEYQNLEELLDFGFSHLSRKGKLIVLTFHSGEQRLVEAKLKDKNQAYQFKYKQKLPSQAEVERNSRARSTTMNIIKRLK